MAQQPPDYQKLLTQLQNANAATSTFEAGFLAANGNATKMNALLADMEDKLESVSRNANSINDTFGDLTEILKQNLAEISKSDSALSSSKKNYRGLVSIAEKLSSEQRGIYDFNVKDLKKLQEKAKSNADNLKISTDLVRKTGDMSEEAQTLLKTQANTEQIARDLLVAIQKRLDLEKKVEKQLGATNALIQGSSKLLSELGFGHLSSELDDLNEKLRTELREEIERNGKAADSLATRFKYMGKGLAGSAKIFANGLSDPLFIVGKVLDTYFKINKASVDLERLTGQNAVRAASLNTSYASAVDYLETAVELTKQTGMNAQNIFSEEVIAGAAELKVTMGLAADEAAGLALVAQTSGRSVDGIVENVVATTSAFNKANRSAVSQGQILRDVAKTSDSIKLSLGNNPEAIAKAASAARAMGMELSQVDRIAESLTDFESSISNELEAQLLTGKDLNLNKARELALNNDLEGVAKELFKNSADINEFGKMNRIQQESYAKALGMSKDELAKMAYQQALAKNMTEEQAAAAAGVNAEDMKRVAAQENFAKALEKIAGALAPILDIIGSMLSTPWVPYLLLGAVAVTKIGSGIFNAAKGMGSLVTGVKDFVSNLNKKGITTFFDKIKGAFTNGATGKGAAIADKAKESITPESGGGGKGMSSLTGSIQKIKPAQLLAGAAALVLTAAAVFIFAKAAQEFGKVSWEDMAKAGVGLLGLVGALALVGTFVTAGGGLVLLAAAGAMLVMAASLYVLGKAIQEIAAGMTELVPALSVLDSISGKASALATVGTSLMGIAKGLEAISSAGAGAMPVLESLNQLGGTGQSAVGTSAATQEGSMKAVEAKLQELINVTKQGMVIKVDGKVLATSNNTHSRTVAQQGK